MSVPQLFWTKLVRAPAAQTSRKKNARNIPPASSQARHWLLWVFRNGAATRLGWVDY